MLGDKAWLIRKVLDGVRGQGALQDSQIQTGKIPSLWIWLCAHDCLIETVCNQPQKCMCETVSTYIWPHRYHTRIVIPALCCITITALMNEQLLKHVSNTNKEEVLLTGVSTCFNGS